MSGGAPTSKQPGRTEQQCTGADRRDIAGAGGLFSNKLDRLNVPQQIGSRIESLLTQRRAL